MSAYVVREMLELTTKPPISAARSAVSSALAAGSGTTSVRLAVWITTRSTAATLDTSTGASATPGWPGAKLSPGNPPSAAWSKPTDGSLKTGGDSRAAAAQPAITSPASSGAVQALIGCSFRGEPAA